MAVNFAGASGRGPGLVMKFPGRSPKVMLKAVSGGAVVLPGRQAGRACPFWCVDSYVQPSLRS